MGFEPTTSCNTALVGLAVSSLPRMQEIMGSNLRIPPRAKFVFPILLYLEWRNVKNCFVILI